MTPTMLSFVVTKTLFTFFATTTPFVPEPRSIVFTYLAQGVDTSKTSSPLSVRSVTYSTWAA